MTVTDIRVGLHELANLRAELRTAESSQHSAELLLSLTEHYQALQDSTDYAISVRSRVAAKEAEVRNAVLAEYDRSGNKRPTDFVGIRVTRKVQFTAEAATAWARDYAPDLLVVDTKRFEKGVLAGVLNGPAVVTEQPTATIATDLSSLEG